MEDLTLVSNGLNKREYLIAQLAAGFASNPELTPALVDQSNGNYQRHLANLAISTANAILAQTENKEY
jgi:hypothetical protein